MIVQTPLDKAKLIDMGFYHDIGPSIDKISRYDQYARTRTRPNQSLINKNDKYYARLSTLREIIVVLASHNVDIMIAAVMPAEEMTL